MAQAQILEGNIEHTLFGVPGRIVRRTTKPDQKPGTWFKQEWCSKARAVKGYGPGHELCVTVSYDDDCGNGHNTFAITGEVTRSVPARAGSRYGSRVVVACGCLHEDICPTFPELAHLVAWHLTSSDGPVHYVANTVFHAGDRDHNGKRAGEPWAFNSAIQFGANPVKHEVKDAFWRFLKDHKPILPNSLPYDFEVIRVDLEERGQPGKYQVSPRYTFGGFGKAWYSCPFETEGQALDFLQALNTCHPAFVQVPRLFSEGKARNLDAARLSAVWPEATDEELCQEPEVLKAALMARLPDLLRRFRAMIDATGLLWEPPASA